MDPAAIGSRVGIVVAAVVSVAAALALRDGDGVAAVRRRLLLGIPWGTLVSAGVVLAVYLFVQGGATAWRDPVVVAFRAWSYFYPLGMVASSFAHASPGHLLGNLFATLALAPLVEFAVGHYPTERGRAAFDGPGANPYVRAFVLVPAGVVAAGVAVSPFTLGPVIGFSVVTFAFGGFALAYYPIRTVVALSVAEGVGVLYRAAATPVVEAAGRPAFVTPWWAGIAIQGHALGFALGVVAAVVLQRVRDDPGPSTGRLWIGATLYVLAQSLWAVYWFRGGGEYVLYRGVGVGLALLLAALVVVAVAADDRPFLPRLWDAAPDSGGLGGLLTERWPPTTAGVAFLVLVVALAGLAGPAVPVNLVAADGGDLPGETVEVRDYEVTYAEGVENGMVSVVDIEAFGESTSVESSGVIVRSTERNVWTTVTSAGRLAFAGTNRVTLGGVGWRRTVVVQRRGWSAVGGDAAYRVSLSVAGADRAITPFASEPAQAGARPAGANVSVRPREGDGGFTLVVERGNATTTVGLPAAGESVAVGNVTYTRRGRAVVAVTPDGTELTVFERERYRGQEQERRQS